MAKSFNFTLFFKKNEDALLIVGLVLIAMFVFGVNADVIGSIQIFKKEPEEVKRVGGGCQLIEGLDVDMWNNLSHDAKVPYCGMAPVASVEWDEIGGPPDNFAQIKTLGTWCSSNVKAKNSPNKVVNNEVRYRDKSGEMLYGDEAKKAIKSRGKES